MSQVWPEHMFNEVFRKDLSEFPRILVIHHPVFECYQVYENHRGATWDARRLHDAIVSEHAHRGQPDHLEHVWWQNERLPYILEEELPARPGAWLVRYLKERAGHIANEKPSAWWRNQEEHKLRRELESRKAVHDLHRDVARDSARHARDVIRGDPLAGKRKWQQVFDGNRDG